MNILIINTLYWPYKIGGAEKSVQILAEGLVRKGYRVRVLTLHQFDYKKYEMVNGVEIVYLPLKNIYWPFDGEKKCFLKKIIWHILDNYNPFMGYLVKKELVKFNPDVVHTNTLAGFSVSIWRQVKKLGIRLVHTSRDYYLFHPNCTLYKKGKDMELESLSVKLWSFLKRQISSNVDYYVGISQYINGIHINNGFFANIPSGIIYNPIDCLPTKKNSLKIETVGFIGRLSKEKGFDEFIELANKNQQLEFLAAGNFLNTEQEAKYKEKCKKLPNLHFLGFVLVSQFVKKIDAAVFPINWNEPFGRAVAEVASSGIPVFSSLKGGIKEIAMIYRNIRPMEDFPNSSKSYQYSEENKDLFDIDVIVHKYYKIYQQIS